MVGSLAALVEQRLDRGGGSREVGGEGTAGRMGPPRADAAREALDEQRVAVGLVVTCSLHPEMSVIDIRAV